MTGPLNRNVSASGSPLSGATRRSALGLILGAPLLGACAGVQQTLSQFGSSDPPPGPRHSKP